MPSPHEPWPGICWPTCRRELADEALEVLAEAKDVRIERILFARAGFT